AKQTGELTETRKETWYRQVADSLQALSTPVPRGTNSEILRNIHTGTDETVPLNPKLDLRENIALYYKKARKASQGKEINARKVDETRHDLDEVESLIAEAATMPDAKDEAAASAFCDRIALRVERLSPHAPMPSPTGQKGQEKIPYRHYRIDSWDIYVGKNDDQNDELTTRFAKPQDLWLHVAGHAGSHLVIRRPSRSVQVPPEVVRKVAGLAVWFSKAKHTSYAEVHVTEARFVRKRRHSPAGQVIAERCTAVRASPCSPQKMFPGKYDHDE
ncbi:MAG: NFACT RNA binding domain-containing protein, partial [Chitinispirillaceae bacterium]|nr:NFACT RNA binding domain-containing protein [Chitinispirillaceae bacterium]